MRECAFIYTVCTFDVEICEWNFKTHSSQLFKYVAAPSTATNTN